VDADSARKYPRIEITDHVLFYGMKLAKLGYYCGDPEKVMRAPCDVILQIIKYEIFENDLEKAYYDLNGSQ